MSAGERPAEEVEEVGHDLAHGRGREVDEVQRAVARVAGMVIDVHDDSGEEVRPAGAIRLGALHREERVPARGPVGGQGVRDENARDPGHLRVRGRPRVAHDDARFLPCGLEREREAERRAEGVAVRVAVAREEEPLPRREELRDVLVGGVDGGVARRHEASGSPGGFGIERSSSSMRAPRSSVWSSAKWSSGA